MNKGGDIVRFLFGALSDALAGPSGSKRVGFWRSQPVALFPGSLPWPEEARWDPKTKERVIAYLKNGRAAEAYFGWSDCRICRCHNGSRDFTDGAYTWPEGLAHYVEAHSTGLPADFVKHVLERC